MRVIAICLTAFAIMGVARAQETLPVECRSINRASCVTVCAMRAKMSVTWNVAATSIGFGLRKPASRCCVWPNIFPSHPSLRLRNSGGACGGD